MCGGVRCPHFSFSLSRKMVRGVKDPARHPQIPAAGMSGTVREKSSRPAAHRFALDLTPAFSTAHRQSKLCTMRKSAEAYRELESMISLGPK